MKKRYAIKFNGLMETGYVIFYLFRFKPKHGTVMAETTDKMVKFENTDQALESATKFRFKWVADLICKMYNKISNRDLWLKTFYVVPLVNGIEDKHFYIKYWREVNKPLGEELGYPSCCIESFCNCPPELMHEVDRDEMKLQFEAGHIDGKFTGFIPCTKHASQIRLGKVTLKELISNRSPLMPEFPFYANHEFEINNAKN